MSEDTAFLCTYRAARNMAFQGLTATRGEVIQLAEIDGLALVGTKVKAPYAINPEVYVLPMDNVLPAKVSFFFHPLTHVKPETNSYH